MTRVAGLLLLRCYSVTVDLFGFVWKLLNALLLSVALCLG